MAITNLNDGDNIFSGSPDDDQIYGNKGNDTLSGMNGNDRVYGGEGNDTLNGNDGDDTLIGGVGNDIMSGGTGNDRYYVDSISDTVNELSGQGWDEVYSAITYSIGANIEGLDLLGLAAINGTGNALDNEIEGNDANNTLSGLGGNDQLDGEGGDDILFGGSGNDNLEGDLGADTMYGGADNDWYDVENTGDKVFENLNEGNDGVDSSVSFTLGANIENLNLQGFSAINGTGNGLDNQINGNEFVNTLVGNAGNDNLNGNDDNDILFGGLGEDRLDGGTGIDKMYGGADDDNYTVDNTADQIFELQDEGWDWVDSSVTYTLAGNVENLRLEGSAAINGAGNALDNRLEGNVNNNILNGVEGNDDIEGYAGNDTILGGAGNDNLNGGLGADIMRGGVDDDRYDVDNAADQVIELQDEGWDEVNSTATFTLGANIENLYLQGISAINGTGNELDNNIDGNAGANILTGLAGNDRLFGMDGNDTLYGGSGYDHLEGGSGADIMRGGADDDWYTVDNTTDQVIELQNEGWDGVNSTATFTLGVNVENLYLQGALAINGTGNALDNQIRGNNQINVLNGGAGNDWLNGNGGNDILYGGLGNDGLNGGIGDDTMYGGAGDDRYNVFFGTDQVIENADEGWDYIRSAVASFTLGANIENIDLMRGSVALNATGNGLENEIYGNENNNVLSGMAGDDQIEGIEGNDTLIGGTGNDFMLGGAGNDTYYVESVGDFVSDAEYVENSEGEHIPFASAGGFDTVFSSVSYSLNSTLNTSHGAFQTGLYIEKLTLTGTLAINGTGNGLANVLVGNTGNNILDGGLGNDNLTGGAGQDSYLFDTALNSTTNTDVIADFSAVDDTIRLDQTIFTKLTAVGTLSSQYFKSSNTGLGDADDYILYNTTSGALLYDADANGSGAAVQFATLTGKPVISNADFLVVA